MNEKTDIARLHTRANIRKVVDYAYEAACIKANVPGKYVFLWQMFYFSSVDISA